MTHTPLPERDDIQRLIETMMNDDLPESLEKRMEESLRSFRRNLPDHPSVNPFTAANVPGRWERLIRLRFVWTAGTAFAAVAAVCFLLLGTGNPSWADIVKHFQSIPFCQASIYVKTNTFAQPIQFEFWMGQGGKLRIRYDRQVIFGEKGVIKKAFDVVRRKTVSPHPDAVHLVDMLDTAETISLETVIRTVAGNFPTLSPVPNSEAETVGHLSVFDIIQDDSREWIRIWTLRESRLPILLRKWNPQGGESVEVVFSYLDQQPALFFDANAFAKVLEDSNEDETSLAYAFLKDPGGRAVTPADFLRNPGENSFKNRKP